MVILSQLLQRLSDADVDFVVVGGFAALIHEKDLLAVKELRAIREKTK